MAERIPVAGPSITELEVRYVADAAANAWYANAGKYNTAFEATFAAYVNCRHAVSLPHCTAGIYLALAALGVGPGDEVVVPDVTWIASAAPITYVGATPIFADIDPDTWCLDAQAFQRAITPRTKAAIVVDLYGSMPDWDALEEIARERGITLIEDAAELIGSVYKGRRAGAFGQVSVFSFHGSKTVTTGEGGMLATNDSSLYERVNVLRDHGRLPGDRFFQNTEVAFKYKMSALQAAMGLAQIERIEELVAHKRQIFRWYKDRLSRLNGIRLNAEPPDTRNSYWMVTAMLDPGLELDKFAVMAALNERSIDSRPFFSPLSSLEAYRGLAEAKRAARLNPVSYRIAPYGVNLPSGHNMTEALVDRVGGALEEILQGKS